jgi:hypothetical protein
VKNFSMKANRILCFTLFTLNIVWGKPGRGGAPTFWLIGPFVVHLAPTGCTSCSMASLAILTSTCMLCVLHQSIWFSGQPFTPTKWVGCMCIVLGAILAWNARVAASWDAVSSNSWIGGKEPATSWGRFSSSHFFTDPAQHFFPVINITS